MIVGIAGPVSPRAFADYFSPETARRLPIGSGVPVIDAYVEALLPRVDRLVVYTLAPDIDRIEHFSGKHLSLWVGPYRLRHRMRDGFAAERAALLTMMKAEPADVIHAHWSYEYPLAAFALGSVPVLTTIHDWAPAVLWNQPTAYRLGRLLMAIAVFRRGRHFAAVSPELAATVEQWTRRRCPVITLGLSAAKFAAAPPDPKAGPPLLVSVNRGFQRRKNVTTLLKAFAQLRRIRPDARLALLGYGHEEGGEAHRWAAGRSLCDGVDFVGEQGHDVVLDWLRRADLCVHPAYEEPLGMAVIEALAQGIAVVASAGAVGPRWILEGERGGVLVDTRAPKILADTCQALLADPGRRHRLAVGGLAMARKRFTIEACAEATLQRLGAICAAP